MANGKLAQLRNVCTALACLLAAAATQASESVNLRVAYVEGPAAQAIVAGRLDDAIEYLTERVSQPGLLPVDELGSLCAAHVLKRDFKSARKVCDDAVEKDGTALAYNNRGVLRAHIGDLNGSIEDFAKIRVLQRDYARYIAQLTEGNARLMATSNFELIRKLRSPRNQSSNSLSPQARGARIEDPGSD